MIYVLDIPEACRCASSTSFATTQPSPLSQLATFEAWSLLAGPATPQRKSYIDSMAAKGYYQGPPQGQQGYCPSEPPCCFDPELMGFSLVRDSSQTRLKVDLHRASMEANTEVRRLQLVGAPAWWAGAKAGGLLLGCGLSGFDNIADVWISGLVNAGPQQQQYYPQAPQQACQFYKSEIWPNSNCRS